MERRRIRDIDADSGDDWEGSETGQLLYQPSSLSLTKRRRVRERLDSTIPDCAPISFAEIRRRLPDIDIDTLKQECRVLIYRGTIGMIRLWTTHGGPILGFVRTLDATEDEEAIWLYNEADNNDSYAFIQGAKSSCTHTT